MKKNQLISSVFILSIFTIIDRALGFLFKIFLSREMIAYQLGLYQIAFSVIIVLLMLSNSGMPLAISKITAKSIQSKNPAIEYGSVSCGIIINSVISIIICLLIFLFRQKISLFLADSNAMNLIILMLPAFIFNSIYAPLKGNIWGHERYFTVSLIEIIEQLSHIILCVILFYLGLNKMMVLCLSLSLACFVSMISCIIFYFVQKGKLYSPRSTLKPLFSYSTPVTLSRTFDSIISSFTSFILPILFISSGYTKVQAVGMLASTISMSLPLLYIPITVIGSLSFAMLPSICKCLESKNFDTLKNSINKAIQFCICFSSCFIPIFIVLGKDIGVCVYDDILSGEFLHSTAFLLIPLSLQSITSSIMNGLDLEVKRFMHSLVGSGVFFAILLCFYGKFNINILSFALISEMIVNCILHLHAINKIISIKYSYIFTLLICLALIFPVCLFSKLLSGLLKNIPLFFSVAINSLMTFIVFIIILWVLGITDKFFNPTKKRNVPLSLAKN